MSPVVTPMIPALLVILALTTPTEPYIATAGSRIYLFEPVAGATHYRAYWRLPGGTWQGPFYDEPAYYPLLREGEVPTHNGNVPLIRHLSTASSTVVELCMTAHNEAGESECSESVFVLWPEYEELWR